MRNPLVSVNLVVRNGEKYIRQCLSAVRKQTYPHLELIVFDNCSTDATREIVRREFPEFRLIENAKNEYVGAGWNKCFRLTHGEYILGLCVDVALDKDFIKNAVAVMEERIDVGALQAKIYELKEGKSTGSIDTVGFEIFKSRRIVNRGHGEKDTGQYDKEEEIFSYEGAAPFWRRKAIEESMVEGEAHDEDFVWYADDIDLGWRMRLLGWKSWYAPQVIAYHDRQTTKRLSRSWRDFIVLRATVPEQKRRLDWQNTRFTFLKNDFFVSLLKDARYFLARELMLLGYIALYERFVLKAIPGMIRFAPRMVHKRRHVMRRRKATRREMEKWFR